MGTKISVGVIAAVSLLAVTSAFAKDDVGAPPSRGKPLSITCGGEIAQAGLALCRTAPGAILEIGGDKVARADSEGWATVAFARDASPSYVLTAVDASGAESKPLTLVVAKRKFEETDVAGLDCDYVVPPETPEVQKKIAVATAKKVAAWKVYSEGRGARDGFVAPGDGVLTSPFGSKRTKHGVGKNGKVCSTEAIHWGQDLRAATGSPVRAPAAGKVILADNLYFEGGAVFLDHGHGLVSIFMHMSKIEVKPGDVLKAGDEMGLAGMTGSANGPHIHWGLKWRNVFEPDGMHGAIYVDPALALQLGREKAKAVAVSKAE
jgi:murein DD-endopeptidase MepM/ murein hydrolase activator NlpD